MAAFFMAVVAVILFAFGLLLGVRIGDELSGRAVTRRDYWRLNLEVLGVGVLVSAVLWATGWLLLVGASFGLLVGAISGLKMGFGESVGPWGAVDRKLGTNKDQVRRAKNPEHAAAVRRARRDGTEMPEVMSVQDDSSDKRGTGTHGSGRGRGTPGKRKRT